MLAQALQLQIVRSQKEIQILRRLSQLLPRQFARVQPGGVQPRPRVAVLAPRRESSLQFPRECELRVRRVREPQLQPDRARPVRLANGPALQRVVAHLLWPSATPPLRPDDALLLRPDAVPVPLPAGALLQPRCVELLLRHGGELLPQRGDGFLLPRDDARLLRHGVELQSQRAGQLLLRRDDALVLQLCAGLPLQRGDARLLRPGVALPAHLSGEPVRELARVRFLLRRREISFPRAVAFHLPVRASALPTPNSDVLLRHVGALVLLQPGAARRAALRALAARRGNALRLDDCAFLRLLAALLILLQRAQFLRWRFGVAALLQPARELQLRSAGVRDQRADAQVLLPAAAIVPAQPAMRSPQTGVPSQFLRGGPLPRF